MDLSFFQVFDSQLSKAQLLSDTIVKGGHQISGFQPVENTKRIQKRHIQYIQTQAWKQHILLLLTFHWQEVGRATLSSCNDSAKYNLTKQQCVQ